MLDTFLVPEKTVIHAKGDGPAVDVSSAGHRVLLATLQITNIIEQESLDVSIYGSADGSTGQQPLLVDLTQHPEVKVVRAHWEASRWGRGTETPMFEFHVTIKEVPPELLREARAEAKCTP
jgi:hypothetical protein